MIIDIEREINNKEIRGIVKINKNFINSRVLFKLHYPNSIELSYYIPDKVFKNPIEVINHITENLETDGLKIEVEPLKDIRKY